MGRVTVEVPLANYWDVQRARRGELNPDEVRRTLVSGIVDSGAARLVLPPSVVQELELRQEGETGVRYADYRTTRRPIVGDVWLELCGRGSVFSAIVEPDRQDALIGAIVLEELDLIVDCTRNEVRRRDPDRIISEIE
ncbi:MAG: clan AA aspartic protease [Planctomycetes bacterium]|nr:clan AA aspartic protease [Planctomycetota bacterium]